jgi:phosphohistidine phosphatase
MVIYFCRHANAGHRKARPEQDARRRLDAGGEAQARQMGAVLAAMGVYVDAVVASPLKRAAQTATLIAEELGHDGDLRLDPALRPEAGYEQFQALLAHYADANSILLVGHKPGLAACLAQLLGARRASVGLKKCAVAKVEVNARKTQLEWLLTPRLIQSCSAMAGVTARPKTARK